MFSFSSKQYEFNYREEMKVLTAFPSRVNPYAVAWRRFAIQSSSTRTHQFQRQSSSSSNSRWKQRQGRDPYARDARLQGLKSRAAFKLLEASLACHGNHRESPKGPPRARLTWVYFTSPTDMRRPQDFQARANRGRPGKPMKLDKRP
jgi:hypothetical protein